MKYELDQVEGLFRRIEKLGIKLEGTANFPWVYLSKVNGKSVAERFLGEHGFTIAFIPLKPDSKYLKLTDIREIFKLIRKYL